MARLTKESIREQDDLKQEEVVVEAWGGDIVLVREPTAKQKDAYEQSLLDARRVGNKMQIKPNFENSKAKLVVQCLIDEEGERLLADNDAGWLGDKSASAIGQIAKVIERLGGMTEEDATEIGENLEIDQQDDSPSS